MTSRNNRRLVIATASACYLAHIASLRKAVHYVCAAHRDEQNRFSYTAAFKWRKAAELFGCETPAAEYCWRQWERIMRLPRRLAGPISESFGFASSGGSAFVRNPAASENEVTPRGECSISHAESMLSACMTGRTYGGGATLISATVPR